MSARKLKVFGWSGWRGGCQTREICAAGSWTEVARLAGQSKTNIRKYGAETGNLTEVAVAMATPGIVFWRDRRIPGAQWTAVARVPAPTSKKRYR